MNRMPVKSNDLRIIFTKEKMDSLKDDFFSLYNQLGFLPRENFIRKNYIELHEFIRLNGGYAKVLDEFNVKNIFGIIYSKAKNLEENGELSCPICGCKDYINSGFNNRKSFKRYECKCGTCRLRYSSYMSAQRNVADELGERIHYISSPSLRRHLQDEKDMLLKNKHLQILSNNQ